MWLLLKGGRIIDPANGIDKVADLLIENGKVSKVDQVNADNLDNSQGRVYDVSGKIITPGLIDMHVHLREPGFEYKENIQTGAEAAAAGGFTTILGMPNTKPALDSRAMVEFVLAEGRKAPVNVLTTGAATKGNDGHEMAEIGDMVASGAVAISDDAFPVQSADLMRMVMEYSKMFEVPFLAHCEDKTLTADGVMNEGIVCTMLGLKPWPRQAEEIMISRNIALAEMTGCRLHIQHVTTAAGVELVRQAKSKGIKVTCETGPQYWSLTDQAVTSYNTNTKMNPPLRTDADVEAIKQGLKDGAIDAIATDHAPHAIQEKEVEYPYAAFGIVGLETSLALTITNLINTGILSWSEAIARMTISPARILGLNAGTLSKGTTADITVIDPEAKWTVKANQFKSKGRNTPFEGTELTGKAVATIVAGELVYGADTLK